jgi:hypothetical protein
MPTLDHKGYWGGLGHNIGKGVKTALPYVVKGGLGIAGAVAGAYLGAHYLQPWIGAKLGYAAGTGAAAAGGAALGGMSNAITYPAAAAAGGTVGKYAGKAVGMTAGYLAGNYLGGKITNSNIVETSHDPVARAIRSQYKISKHYARKSNPNTRINIDDITRRHRRQF